MNDLETALHDALAEHVDGKLGPRRPAPSFRPTAGPGGRRPRWVLPLLAAACVAAVVGATIGAQELTADRQHAPATRPPSPSATIAVTSAPSPTTSTGTVPNRGGSASRQSSNSPKPATHQVRLGGAEISLPAGWVARSLSSYVPNGASPVFPGWCLTPKSVPVSQVVDGCPMSLSAVGAAAGQPLDVDLEGGYASNPAYCALGARSRTEQTGDRSLGGRPADWRHWMFTCSNGKTYDIEQYVVPTAPGYVLYTEHSDARYHAAMNEVAVHSTLPAQGAPVRLMDRGYLRSVTRASGGYRISLDRTVLSVRGTLNKNPATYSYDVPSAVFAAGDFNGKLVPGALVYLASNGSRVTQIYREPTG